VTVPGKGYRFVADVTADAQESEDSWDHRLQNPETVDTSRTFVEISDFAEQKTSTPEPSLKSQFAVAATCIGAILIAAIAGYQPLGDRIKALLSNGVSAVPPQMSVTRITDGRLYGAPSISPDGKLIAYIENDFGGSGSLFVRQTNTNRELRIFGPGRHNFGCTDFSRDGSLIYFVMNDQRRPDSALYSIPVFGGTPKMLVDKVKWCFALSPDEKQLAFYRDDPEKGKKSIVIATTDGTREQELLARNYDEMWLGFFLSWSRDGKTLVFSSDPEPDDFDAKYTLYSIDVSSGSITPLTDERFAEIGSIRWTPDGSNLIFVAKRGRGENRIWLLEPAGGDLRAITSDVLFYGNYGLGITDDGGTLVAAVWERKEELARFDLNGDPTKAVRIWGGASNGRTGLTALPDGRIAYITRAGEHWDIWIVNEEGTDARPLTADPFVQRDVGSSPDGRYLVFASDMAGESHIFRMSADDGSSVTQLTFGSSIDSLPSVSPDGKNILFTMSDGRTDAVARVSIDGVDTVRLTDYSCGAPVFSPDGKSIACVLPSNSHARRAAIAILPADGGKPLKTFPVLPFSHGYDRLRWTADGSGILYLNWHNDVYNLWLQPVSGEAPRRLTDFTFNVWNFELAHDAKTIFLSQGQTFTDIVVIKDFR